MKIEPNRRRERETVSFGRQNNLSRRANRADESFHRDKRRKKVDRLGMLETARRPRRPSALKVLFSALTGFLRRRR